MAPSIDKIKSCFDWILNVSKQYQSHTVIGMEMNIVIYWNGLLSGQKSQVSDAFGNHTLGHISPKEPTLIHLPDGLICIE